MHLLKRFISFTSITLSRFIFTATLIVSIVTFLIVLSAITWIFLIQAEDVSKQTTLPIASRIFVLITDAMRKGDNLTEIRGVVNEYQKSLPDRYTVTIYPAMAVKTGVDNINIHSDEPIRTAFLGGKNGS
jgi:hypothetical protein